MCQAAPDLSWGGRHSDPTASARGESQGSGQLQTHPHSLSLLSHCPSWGGVRWGGCQHFLAFPAVLSRVSPSSLCRPGDRSPRCWTTRPEVHPRGHGPITAADPASGDLAPSGGWRGRNLGGGLCATGVGPWPPLCTSIGRWLRTGGCTSRAGPTLLAMSSDCCTPNLSIYSTGIEAAGAALAPANHGWDFLFRPLFVSLWDLRRCHRF